MLRHGSRPSAVRFTPQIASRFARLALGYVKPQFFEDAAAFEIELLGKRRPATLSAKARFDPDGTRMRG